MLNLPRVLGLIALLGLVVTPLSAQAESELPALEEILERHYEAIGGVDAWAAVETLSSEGTISSARQQVSPFARAHGRPLLFREETAFRGGSTMRGFDGRRAWAVLPMGDGRAVEMPRRRLPVLLAEVDPAGLLMDWEIKGYRLRLLGTESSAEGPGLYRVEVAVTDDAKAEVLLNSEGWLTESIEVDRLPGRLGEGPLVMSFSDYRRVEDIVLPHRIETRMPGLPTPRVRKIDQVEINPSLPEGTFTVQIDGPSG